MIIRASFFLTVNEYDEILKQMDEEQHGKASRSLYSSVDVNPEQETSLHKISRRSGIPVEALRLDNGTEAKRRVAADEATTLAQESPRTAEYLSNPENARISHDDTETLAAIENIVRNGFGPKGPVSTLTFGTKADMETSKKAREYVNAVVGGLKASVSSFNAGLAETGRIAAEVAGVAPALRAAGLDEIADAPRFAETFWKSIAEEKRAKTRAGTLPYYLGQAAESGATSLMAAPFGLAGEGPALGMFALSSSGGQEELTQSGFSETGAALVSIPKKIMEGLTEKIGLDALYQKGKPLAKAMTEFVFKDLLGEEVNTLYNAIADKVTVRPDMTWHDLGQDVVDTAIVTALQGGMQGAAMHSAARGADYLQGSFEQARRTQAAVSFMEALGDTTKESKTYQRLPDRLKDLVSSLTEDGPVENVYVPAEKLRELFQDKVGEPDRVVADILDDPDSYYQALATGGDVVIPLPEYVERWAGTEFHQSLIADIRLHPGDMSQREFEEWKKRAPEEASSIFGQFADSSKLSESTDQKVYDAVLGELLGAGRERSAAEREAGLWQARYRTRAERMGKDAWTMYEQNPLRVRRPMPEFMTRRDFIDTSIDPFLDRLRANDVPTGKEVFGDTLGDFLRIKGVQDEKGELAALGVDEGLKPFQRKMVQESGLPLDKAREAAVEAGYLPEASTVADFLNLIDQDARQGGTYSTIARDEALASVRADLEDLRRYLDGLGVDVSSMSNEDIRKSLKSTTEGVAYSQSAQGGFNGDQSGNDRRGQDQEREGLGDPLQAAADVARRSRESSAEDARSAAGLRSAEEESLREFARVNNLILDSAPIMQKVTEQNTSGTDNFVYEEGGRFYKVNRFTHAKTFTDLFSNITLHNSVFGDSVAYRLEGFTDVDGRLLPVFSQPEIKNDLADDPKEAERLAAEDLLARGFTREDGSFGFVSTAKFTRGDIVVRDINSRNVVIQDGTVYFIDPVIEVAPEAQTEENIREFFQTYAEGNRGSITFRPGLRDIALLEKADLSTFLHETGHAWLEELRQDAQTEDAPSQVRNDWETIALWAGIASDSSTISVEAHEKFARAVEAYVMEGKAPSVELQASFQRFRAWLLRIYRDIKKLNVDLTREVRAVLDRMLATDEEIERAERMQGFTALFTDASSAGMTDREFSAYRGEAEKAHQEASTKLQQKLMKDLSREQEAWWKEERSKVRDEVEAEAKRDPVYIAFNILTTGETFDGEKMDLKLSRQDLVKMYGEAFVKKLPRSFHRIYSKEGGAHPDIAAEALGFTSGDEMIRKMANTPPLKKFVDAETDVRMREVYGDMLNDGTIADEALRALHTDYQGQVLRAELRALRRKQREVAPYVKAEKDQAKEAARREKAEREYERRWMDAEKKLAVEIERGAGEEKLRALREEIRSNKEAARRERMAMDAGIPPLEAFRNWAKETISQKPVRDIRPHVYLQAEQKYGREAFEAASKGKYDKAGEAKQLQLLNHYLYTEAVKVLDEVETVKGFMAKMEKPRAQGILGKAGLEYQEAMNALLEQYEFRKVTNRELDYRSSLAAFAKKLQASGRDASAIETIQLSLKTNYREMNVSELRGVYDTARFAYHMAKTAHDFILGEQRFAKEMVQGEVTRSILENAKKTAVSMENLSGFKAIKKGISDFIANSYTADTILFQLDGWERMGPAHRYIKGVIDEAVSRDLLPMQNKAGEDIEQLYSVYSPKELRAMHTDRFFIPEMNGSFTKEEILSLALNQGNEGNREAVTSSRIAQSLGLTQDRVNAIIDRHMDERDWQFAQSVWDYIGSYWEQIAEKQRQRKGIIPEQVAKAEVVTRFGTFPGGYYPLKYDTEKSVNAAQDSAEEFFTSVRQGRFSWAQTSHGHTIERVGSGGRAVLLSMSVFHSHINQVITDLALGDAVNFSASVLNDAVVKSAFEDAGAVHVRKYLDVWLTDTAMGEKIGSDMVSRTFRYLRTGIAARSMLFNVGVGLQQFTGLFQTAGTIGSANTVHGIKELLNKPWTGENSVGWQIARMSPFMAKREDTFQKDMMDFLGSFKKSRTRNFLSEYGMLLIKKGQHVVDMASWLGALHQAQSEGKTEDDAIAYADRMVARSQGSGLFSDRSALERGSLGQDVRQSEFVRAMTTLLSYQIAKFNVMREKVGRTDFRDVGDVVQLAGDTILLYWLDTSVALLMRGVWPGGDDDDESWAWTVTKETAGAALSAIPAMRDIVSAFQGFPAGGVIGTLGDALKKTWDQVAQGDMDIALFKAANSLGGMLLRYPSSAINRFVGALSRDLDGEDVRLIEYVMHQEKGGK